MTTATVRGPGRAREGWRSGPPSAGEGLRGAVAGLGDVLKTTVYVATTDRADLHAAWTVVREAFGGHDAPSTLVGVTVLGYPDQLVEVEAIAVRDSWEAPGPPDEASTVAE